MNLLDKLRALSEQPDDTDLAAYLGLKPGDRFALTRDSLTVGGETVPMLAVRSAVGIPEPAQAEPRRIVTIGDL